MRWSAITLLLVSLIFAPVAAVSETRALLIGVSDYDSEAGLADLKGPVNDVRLMHRVLTSRGISNISVLADGFDQGDRPTREAILSALAELAASAAAGDFIYIHFSGHGTRQIDLNGDESDGLDEVFLPADARPADAGENTIPNAIVDEEIGAALHEIRKKGADVWIVIDSCFSGSGVRAGSVRVASRFVDPALLGISLRSPLTEESGVAEAGGAEPEGGLIAFYAARSTEVAREVDMAPGGAAEEEFYGLFTAKLAARLDAAQDPSFRALFQGVLKDMNDFTLPGGVGMQTPLWEGTLIDAPIFGGTATIGMRRFPVSGDELSAGLLHGVPEGSLVGLVRDIADPPDALVGFAQTEDTAATRSFLRPVGETCVPRNSSPCARAGALPDDARFAQIIARPIDQTVGVAPPRDLRTGEYLPPDAAPVVALLDAVEEANTGGDYPVRVTTENYAAETVWDGAALWIGAQAVIGDTPTGLRWISGQDDLAALIRRVAKAETLARALAEVSSGASILSPSPVEISARLHPSDINDLAEPDAGVSPLRECSNAVPKSLRNEPVPFGDRPDLKQCDFLNFFARGKRGGERDVNLVHIDARYCVRAEYQRLVDDRAPIRISDDMVICSDCPDGYAAGHERLFVVVTESQANREAMNLEGLVETCGIGAGTRGVASERVTSLLQTFRRIPGTRSSFGGLDILNIWVESYDWRVLPRTEAFARFGRRNEN